MFQAKLGDLFASGAQTLVNTVNCVGVMGKGVALEFKRRFPGLFEDYAARCQTGSVRPGEPYLYEDLFETRILNFPTKDHWRSPSRFSDIERGLDRFVEQYQTWGITSIAFPPLGCGNGGLSWADVGPLMYRKLHSLPIDIQVFAPYGTSPAQLTADFLGGAVQQSISDEGQVAERMPASWAVIVETLRQLAEQPYAAPIGRTIFQKVCYIQTALGLKTGFEFGRGSYGPFAEEGKRALHIFANRNWIREEPRGRMIALRVEPGFDRDRPRFAGVIAEHTRIIDRTVDLFSRIKSTDQAEELMTIIFASQELKAQDRARAYQEQDLIEHIIAWKKRWGTPDKRTALATSIRNLVLLGWLKLELSETAEDAAVPAE
jgi:O-acetyl-ADP-ribose deacetylase (regulator of RNase III)